MQLYHFTAKHLAKKIKKQGLTLGFMPVSLDPPKADPGYIWLTSNKSWEQECLRGSGRLPYKRNEVRMTVVIPDHGLSRILKFDQNKDLSPIYEDMTRYGDPENWYIYKGIIPKGWIRKIETQEEG